MSGGHVLRLPAVFGDHLVLQQGQPIPVWGWAAPGAKVEVTLATAVETVEAGADGRWRVDLPAQPAGGPFELSVASGRQTVVRSDVLVGEVWLCSGQSNMEMPLRQARDAEAESAVAVFPRLRFFTVNRVAARHPQSDCGGTWQVCSPGSALDFSAAGYFFGRKLHQELNVPVGLIHSSWGGTAAEAWTPLAHLAAHPQLKHYADYAASMDRPEVMARYHAEQAAWEDSIFHQDTGMAPETRDWARPDIGMKGWASVSVPGDWEESLGLNIDGAVWFRHEFDIPAAWAGRDLTLDLGPVDDFDTTYFNGKPVGATGPETPNANLVPRSYAVPGRLVRTGRAVIAVRIFDRYGRGGFTASNPLQMALVAPEGVLPERLPIAGTWRYRVERALTPKTPSLPEPIGPDNQNFPAALYNGMIAPLAPFGLRGAIWYQGESNANTGGRAREYNALFPALIHAWREAWKQGTPEFGPAQAFHFHFVQLANHGARALRPGWSYWAEVREAQLRTLVLRHTGMAVAIDIGDADDVHPKNKQDVGLRLALNALARTYGRRVACSGPMFRRMTVRANRVTLEFSHTEGGLAAHGGKLSGFAVAGADRRFVWAKATIDVSRSAGHGADTVVVTNPRVREPVAVRYGWADNPDCTLFNGAGLPASPFRTDRWSEAGE